LLGCGGGTGGGEVDAAAPDGNPSVPTVTINHPGDGETRLVSDGDFPFVGVANDLEDGALTGAALVWTSDLDGQLGTGETFNATPSLGVHTITLTATDADSNSGIATITLTMEP
jgi:chitinase